MSMDTYLKILFVLSCLAVCSVDCGYTHIDAPPTCCSPDQWEADILATAAQYRGSLEKLKLKSKLGYDYKHKRWAFEQINPSNSSENVRLFFDYKNGKKYYIAGDKCVSSNLGGNLFQYCVPENATYHGYFEVGHYDHKLGYDLWSWELVLFPLAFRVKVSRDTCMPLHEGSFGLVANTWSWFEGEPPCNPWQSPTRVRSGNCYKSYNVRSVRRRGAELTAQFANAVYANIHSNIRTATLFKVPDKCKEVKTWGSDIKLDALQMYYTIRFQLDEEWAEVIRRGSR